MTRNPIPDRVVVRGAGEMASGVIRRLSMAGFDVIALERPVPTCVRRQVCFAEAFFVKRVSVEGVTGVLVSSAEESLAALGKRCVPLLIDPRAEQLAILAPIAVIDGRMLKRDIDSHLDLVPVVIGLGPGFTTGKNCHAAVETERGIDLGRVYYVGSPRPDSGTPAPVNGFGHERVLRSPADGEFISCCKIGDVVEPGQVLGRVAGVTIAGQIDGMVRGIVHDGVRVSIGQKIGDLDPLCIIRNCYKVSDRANAVAGGVLEALMVMRADLAG